MRRFSLADLTSPASHSTSGLLPVCINSSTSASYASGGSCGILSDSGGCILTDLPLASVPARHRHSSSTGSSTLNSVGHPVAVITAKTVSSMNSSLALPHSPTQMSRVSSSASQSLLRDSIISTSELHTDISPSPITSKSTLSPVYRRPSLLSDTTLTGLLTYAGPMATSYGLTEHDGEECCNWRKLLGVSTWEEAFSP
ncbi:unnamed protein product, partial [Protopolystoma xenopodis]